MIRCLIPLALLALAANPATAQQTPPPAATPPAVASAPAPQAVVRVSLQTSAGPILLELEAGRAPITTANFLRYVDQRRLDGIAFYRAVKVTPEYGLIQAGVRNDPKRVLPPIAHEPTSQTGLSHIDGAISMARNEPGSASGDFFITIGAFPSMDADPSQPGDNQGFAVFGHVVQGMDVVRTILAAPPSPTLGEGEMKGQMLADPVRIFSARRVEAPAPAQP